MAESITMARPYARAAFEYARERNELATWSELLTMAAHIAAEPSIVKLNDDPNISWQQLANLVIEIMGSLASEPAHNFIKLLLANKRFLYLPQICLLFKQFKAQSDNVIEVKLSSAYAVTSAQQAQFSAALEKRFGAKVVLNCHVDQSLLGGAIIYAGDKVIDGSIRGRLAQLTDFLNA